MHTRKLRIKKTDFPLKLHFMTPKYSKNIFSLSEATDICIETDLLKHHLCTLYYVISNNIFKIIISYNLAFFLIRQNYFRYFFTKKKFYDIK
jgi:hypothetical protein